MIDLIIRSIIITPTFPIIIFLNIRATEMINTIRFPAFGKYLRPFNHGVSVKGCVCHIGCFSPGFLSVIIRVKIVCHSSIRIKHTRTRHKLLTRRKVPSTIIERTAKSHFCWSKSMVIDIAGVCHSILWVGGIQRNIIPEQVIPLPSRGTCSIRLATVISTGRSVRKCRIVIGHAKLDILVSIGIAIGNILKELTIILVNRIRNSALPNHRTSNACRQSRFDLDSHRVRTRVPMRFRVELLHRLRLINHKTIRRITIIYALCGKWKSRIIIGTIGFNTCITESGRRSDSSNKISIKLICGIIRNLSTNYCTGHSTQSLTVNNGIAR